LTDISPVRVAIVGGGIIGMSIAAYLAQKNEKDIYLIEQNKGFGREETATSAAMIMTNVYDSRLVRPTIASREEYGRLHERFGFDPEIHQCGSVLISTTVKGVERLEYLTRLQREQGRDTRLLTRKEILNMIPLLRGGDINAGIYCPDDGYIDQTRLVDELRYYAKMNGVNLWSNTKVIRITKSSDGIFILQTNNRDVIPAEKIVIAAGAGSPTLALDLGYYYPVIYSRRELFTAESNTQDMPIIEFVDGGNENESFYIRPNGERSVLVGAGPTINSYQYPEEQPALNREITSNFLGRRFPGLKIGELTCNIGTRTMTSDGLGYIGPLDRDVIAAYGLSGFGITLAPFCGRRIARYVVEGEKDEELEYCDPRRTNRMGL
jgi:glycine/D-amino acid oxidase-like deaminating enzyme